MGAPTRPTQMPRHSSHPNSPRALAALVERQNWLGTPQDALHLHHQPLQHAETMARRKRRETSLRAPAMQARTGPRSRARAFHTCRSHYFSDALALTHCTARAPTTTWVPHPWTTKTRTTLLPRTRKPLGSCPRTARIWAPMPLSPKTGV